MRHGSCRHTDDAPQIWKGFPFVHVLFKHGRCTRTRPKDVAQTPFSLDCRHEATRSMISWCCNGRAAAVITVAESSYINRPVIIAQDMGGEGEAYLASSAAWGTHTRVNIRL